MEFKEIFTMDDGGGYDWSELHVFQREDGAYAVDHQSGCSCNGYETPGVSELEWVHGAGKLYEQFDQELKEHKYTWNAAQAIEGRAELRKIVAEASK